MTEITKLPAWMGEGQRPETGPMQFGDDWPGVFIRGDNALNYGTVLLQAVKTLPMSAHQTAVLRGLANTLLSCAVQPAREERT